MKESHPIIKYIMISSDEVGRRIDNFLCTHLKGVPKSMLYRMIRKGNIRINKKRIKPKYKLIYGDELRIPKIRQAKNREITYSYDLEKLAIMVNVILYEDDFLLIINKPAGIAVHGGSGLSFGIIEALRILRPYENFLELVHRLDRNTSGVLVIAKKRSALSSLHEQLRMKYIKKDYLVLVQGQWNSHVKIISVPLLKHVFPNGKRMVYVNYQGKPSKTLFKVEERFTSVTLVKASPITGRTHQIRVHTQYAGHPIVFDDSYGDKEFDHKLKDCGLNRMFLHALSLKFKHPNNGQIFYIEAPIDKKLSHCLLYLRANYKQ